MSDHRDELIDTQRKLIAAQERHIALLQALLASCQQTKQTTPAPRKDVQA